MSTPSPSINGRISPSIKADPAQEAVRAEVAKEFVLKDHMRPIEMAGQSANCIYSFRQTGALTLKRLALGAPAKGHDILDKTIKEKSIRSIYSSPQADAVFAALKNADLLGYVGKWDQDNKKLLGLYVGPDHQLGDLVKGGIYAIDIELQEIPTNGSASTWQVNMDRLHASLEPLKAHEDWRKWLFTGDYDVHEMPYLGGRRANVASDSRDEKRLIDHMNAFIAAFDPKRCHMPPEYSTAQHGAQSAGPAALRARNEKVPAGVANADYPVAFVHKGIWTIVRNDKQHLAFYKKLRLNMKSTWLPKTTLGVPRRHSR